jgi:hypothetical protein
MSPPAPSSGAFGALRQALVRRRLRQLDPVLRAELVLLVALAAGFLYWQTRVPLDGLARARGPAAVAGAVAILMALLAAAGGVAAGARHAAALGGGAAGPAWLALPAEPRDLARHLAWESAGPAGLTAPAALAVLAAAWGLVPLWWLLLLGAGYAWLLAEAVRAGTALALRVVAARSRSRVAATPVERALHGALHSAGRARRPAPRGWRGPAWLALWRKDLAVTTAPSPARARLLPPFAFGVASVAIWFLPIEPLALRRALAFALALATAATLAEWLIALAGSDPFPVLRALPVGAPHVWSARAASALVLVLALLVAHAAAARAMTPVAVEVFLVWTGAASLAIAALGVNYGVTLFPRADLARRLLALSLGLAVAASLMIPLSGWVLLIAGVIHSARRLPRWARLEEA